MSQQIVVGNAGYVALNQTASTCTPTVGLHFIRGKQNGNKSTLYQYAYKCWHICTISLRRNKRIIIKDC